MTSDLEAIEAVRQRRAVRARAGPHHRVIRAGEGIAGHGQPAFVTVVEEPALAAAESDPGRGEMGHRRTARSPRSAPPSRSIGKVRHPDPPIPSASFVRRSLVFTCCSTPEKVASCTAKSDDSIGFSGSLFFIWTVSILRKVSKSELRRWVRVACGFDCALCAGRGD